MTDYSFDSLSINSFKNQVSAEDYITFNDFPEISLSLISPHLNQATQQIKLREFLNTEQFKSFNGQGASVVVIDTGIDVNHPFFGPDLDHNGVADRLVYQYDFADEDGDASDVDNHGSHVTSIIASQDANYTGIVPGVDIIALKVFPDGVRSADIFDIEQALQWVVNNAQDYNILSVNLSLGFGNYNISQQFFPISDELTKLKNQGVVVVASSGNSFNNSAGVAYPSADPNVLSIGAVKADDTLFSWSQRHPQLTTTLAPGGPIVGANRQGGVVTLSGTSMAAPLVTGTVVLAQQLAQETLGRKLTFSEIDNLLRTTGTTIYDSQTQANYQRLDIVDLSNEILKLASPVVNSSLSAIGEFGRISLDSNFKTIQLEGNYLNPVIFVSLPSFNDQQVGNIRVVDLSNNQFSAFFQEANYLDGEHADETVSYLVLEAGTWQLEDGTLLEVGTVGSNGLVGNNAIGSWSRVNFSQSFAETPVVISQVQTYNDPSFVQTRQRRVSGGGVELALQSEEALLSTPRQSETIGWLAISPGEGKWNNYSFQADVTPDALTHQQYNLNFGVNFTQSPEIFGSIASFGGRDPASLRYQGLNNNSVQISLQEDQSNDLETNHTTEKVSFLAIEGRGMLKAQALNSSSLSQGFALKASSYEDLLFSESLTSPLHQGMINNATYEVNF